jgi:hypothetical protein
MGVLKAKEPMISKVAIGPAIMIPAATDPATLGALAKNRAQATADPAVYGRKGPPITMFEVPEPTAQSRVDVGYDDCQTVAIASFSLCPEGVLEFLQALLAGPTGATLKMIAEEIKTQATNRGINQPCLSGMQTQILGCGQLLHKAKRFFGFCMASAQDDKVIGIPHHVETCLGHGNIDRVQIQIGKQRADHCSLGSPFLRSPLSQSFQNVLLKEGLYQGQHSTVCNVFANFIHELDVRDAVKVSFKVSVYDMDESCLKKPCNFPEGILAPALWSESIVSFNKRVLPADVSDPIFLSGVPQ